MNVRLHCPGCQRICDLSASWLGKRVRCPECKHVFTAEGPMAATPPAEIAVHALQERPIPVLLPVPLPRTTDHDELEPREIVRRRGGSGETLAVLALLLPLLAQGLALACRFDSRGIEVAVGWGTVGFTALVLAVGAAVLGSIDLQGTRRAGPGALFLGMILFWIVFYPLVFFRRRHFGRPNLGPWAILVAVFFVAVPFVQEFMLFGVVGGGPPACTSRE